MIVKNLPFKVLIDIEPGIYEMILAEIYPEEREKILKGVDEYGNEIHLNETSMLLLYIADEDLEYLVFNKVNLVDILEEYIVEKRKPQKEVIEYSEDKETLRKIKRILNKESFYLLYDYSYISAHYHN